MLDINLFRPDRGGDPDRVRLSQRRRHAQVGQVDEVMAADEQWRRAVFQARQARTARNALQARIQGLFQAAEPPADEATALLLGQKGALDAAVTAAVGLEAAAAAERDALLGTIGNLVAGTVPAGRGGDRGFVGRVWGEAHGVAAGGLGHGDLLHRIGGIEHRRGARVAGSRGYFLRGPGARLNMALSMYAVQFLTARGFMPVQTPTWMEAAHLAVCAPPQALHQQLYSVAGEGGDKYLVASPEQPLGAYHAREWLDPRGLPARYAPVATCFRRGAVCRGPHVRGLDRVHQGDQVGQYVVTTPDGSAAEMKALLTNTEDFYESLSLPFRTVRVVAGGLPAAAAEKVDLEGWYPAAGEYRALASIANHTDYQTRLLGTRIGVRAAGGQGEHRLAHTVTSTMCATTRVLGSILENYQTAEGVAVPSPLRQLIGAAFFPFVRSAGAA